MNMHSLQRVGWTACAAICLGMGQAEGALYARPRQFTGATPAEFQRWQAESREHLATILVGPIRSDRPALQAKEELLLARGTYDLYTVTYQSTSSRTNYAFVSVPKKAGKHPVLLALHGHECATDIEAFTRRGHIDDFYGYFAERGFIVVGPDVLNHRISVPEGSTLPGVWLHDALRALDYALSRPDADAGRVGSVGLSTGGFLCLYGAALDERIRAAVPAGVFSTMKHDFTNFNCPPGCDCGMSKIAGLRDLDYCDVAGVIAPRAVRIMHGKQDTAYYPGTDPRLLDPRSQLAVMDPTDFDSALAESKRLFSIVDAAERFDMFWHAGAHAVNNEAAYEWITRQLGVTPVAHANVNFHTLFSPDMVLQRDAPIPVWGAATPGEHVSVSLADQTLEIVADDSGQWRVMMAPMPAGGPYDLAAKGDTQSIKRNVLIGDVWVCSGQSNMGYAMDRAIGAKDYVQNLSTNIRLAVATAPIRSRPSKDMYLAWNTVAPGTSPGFSAVGLVFGDTLQKKLGVPIGLIQASANASVAEAWTPHEAMANDPALSEMIQIVDKATEDHRARLAEWPAKLEAWHKRAQELDRAGLSVEPPPGIGSNDPRSNPFRPAGMFNGVIAPLTQFPIKGVIWYQGESNGGLAHQYRSLLPALIAGWREAWKQPDLPLLIVQLPGHPNPDAKPGNTSLAELREAQLMTWQRVPHTAMIVTLDLGAEPGNPAQDWLHPPNKIPVGQRLALAARAEVYGEKDLLYTGPIYKSMRVENGRIRLAFTRVESGLTVKGDKLTGFAIAGEDRQFVDAQAFIDKDTVVVESPDVPAPVAVRYSFTYKPDPLGNLFNQEGLPASSFRTDDWPVSTTGTKYWW